MQPLEMVVIDMLDEAGEVEWLGVKEKGWG